MGPYFIKSWVPIGSLFLSLEVPISFGNSAKRKYVYKKPVMEKLVVLDTALLRNCIEEREAVTGNPDQCYIVDWNFDDSEAVIGKLPSLTISISGAQGTMCKIDMQV